MPTLSPDMQPTRTIHIIATKRARRPEELASKLLAKVVPTFVEACPFCAGNESPNVRCERGQRPARLQVSLRCIDLDHGIAHVTIFKNHGADAGASLEHPHSQLIATPVISHRGRERFQQAPNHYDEYGECMFCQSLEEEIADRQPVVLLTEHFVVLELYASPTPSCTPIYPRRHMASFVDIS